MLNNNSGKEYFGEEFIKEFESILQECKENESFLFMHGTPSKDDADEICSCGLKTDFPDLYYTAELISNEDMLLYDKLKSWPHWDCKFLIMCCVPENSGKGGIPIWSKSSDGFVVLPPEFIRGYIDVIQKRIVENKLYSRTHDFETLIEDRSYLPITAERLGISIPPDEEEFYNEIFDTEK